MTKILLQCDIAIFGGGIAGLWLLAELRQQGYQALLFETEALGAGQTRFAQGIIHGGTKYALMGKLTASSEAIAAMPKIWRDSIDGKSMIDLTKVKTLSNNQCMWSDNALSSRMAGFFASKMMRSRTQELKGTQRPLIFQHKLFKGKVYNLDEPVLDTASIITALSTSQHDAIMHIKDLPVFDSEKNTHFTIKDVEDNNWQIQSHCCVLMAGQGNQAILNRMKNNINQPKMQLRPLKMVMLRGNLPEKIYAHCLEANVNPRLTITSHEDSLGEIVWYMGGQVAEEGVHRNANEQIEMAKQELKTLMPWIDFSNSQWACLDINRAEPLMDKGKRPDTSFFIEQDNIITAWPTKLALAPKLAQDIIAHIKENKIAPMESLHWPHFPKPDVALLPWQEEHRWR